MIFKSGDEVGVTTTTTTHIMPIKHFNIIYCVLSYCENGFNGAVNSNLIFNCVFMHFLRKCILCTKEKRL